MSRVNTPRIRGVVVAMAPGWPRHRHGVQPGAIIPGMKRWARLLVWMLTLALPLAGLAAGAPALALGGMHAAASALALPADTAAPPCHAVMPDDGDSGVHHGQAADTHAGCAQCAVCHAGSAPAPRTAASPEPRPGAAAVPRWDPPHVTIVDTGGLDRPPRRPFA